MSEITMCIFLSVDFCINDPIVMILGIKILSLDVTANTHFLKFPQPLIRTWRTCQSFVGMFTNFSTSPVFSSNIRVVRVANINSLKTFRIVWPCIVTNSLWIKPTDALNFKFIGITILHVSGSLSAHHQEFLAVRRHWYILCSFDDSLQFNLAPGSQRSSELHKMYQCRCTAKNSWWWAEKLPETYRVVIPINLEFSVSFDFTHKEFLCGLCGYGVSTKTIWCRWWVDNMDAGWNDSWQWKT
jgi:hypothetical protein